VPDADGLTRPVAFVVAREPGEAPDEEALREFVRDRLAHYKVPRRFIVKRELPQTHLGKVDRGRLRREAQR